MEDLRVHDDITIDAVKNLLVEDGYEVSSSEDESCIFVKDPDSGFTLTCVLENNILFNTLVCVELEENAITAELMRKLLDSDNGISTSSFQLYATASNKVVITLNNFCKLQDLGHEDRDDLLSCLEFLNVDVMAARELLSAYI